MTTKKHFDSYHEGLTEVLYGARGEVCNGEELDTKGGGRFWVGAVVLHHSQIDSFVCSIICQAKRRFVSSQS